MIRAIIGLVNQGEPEHIEAVNRDNFVIEIEQTATYLDNSQIRHGTAGITEHREKSAPVLGDGTINEREELVEETITTEFYEDLVDAGFVAVDSSDGDFLFNQMITEQGTEVVRGTIDLNSFAREIEDKATFWQVGYTDDEDVGIVYHDGAKRRDPQKGTCSQLGFQYQWNGRPVRGTAAKSGYVALFSDMEPDQFGAWLREEIIPHATIELDEDEEFLQEISEDGSSEQDESNQDQTGLDAHA